LIEALIPLLAKQGFRTAVIKHHGHGFEDKIPDKPGTDTYRFLAAGACGTVIYDDATMMCVKRGAMTAERLVPLFNDADIVFLEGAKDEPVPRIEMLRVGHPVSSDPATLLCAVVEAGMETPPLPNGVPIFPFGEFAAVARLLAERFGDRAHSENRQS
ncbi:MAG: molybdopterin-guanine dinucleotide biosynthesis protein MobB, partial [Clostridiales Family XIII bacterium]|nr:molybdopterin-guanine dinucleotide biosynthesis protein MobB [Clostridiales Family XIII bacterium]